MKLKPIIALAMISCQASHQKTSLGLSAKFFNDGNYATLEGKNFTFHGSIFEVLDCSSSESNCIDIVNLGQIIVPKDCSNIKGSLGAGQFTVNAIAFDAHFDRSMYISGSSSNLAYTLDRYHGLVSLALDLKHKIDASYWRKLTFKERQARTLYLQQNNNLPKCNSRD